jgi:hypothetical protein
LLARSAERGGQNLLPKISRVIFEKWRERRSHSQLKVIARWESWKNFSLRKEQGEASRISGKNGGTAGCKRSRTQGSRKDGHGKCPRSPSPRSRGATRRGASGAVACDGMARHLRAALQQGHSSARPKDALAPMKAWSEFETRRDCPSDQFPAFGQHRTMHTHFGQVRLEGQDPKCLVSVDFTSDSSRRTSPGVQRGRSLRSPALGPARPTTHHHEVSLKVDFPD